MHNYQELLLDVLALGNIKEGRNGYTKSLFGVMFRHNMMDGFPLLTTKYVSFKSVVGELKWMLSGSTDVTELRETYGVTFWDEWGPDIGPGYGHQIRHFGGNHNDTPESLWWGHSNSEPDGYPFEGKDQLAQLIDGLIKSPHSRRHIVSHWDPNSVENTKLPPCHVLWQVNIDGNYVDLMMFQRSADLFLGVPYNIGFYGLLLELISCEVNRQARNLVISFGDLHLYENAFSVAEQQAQRRPNRLPRLDVRYDEGDLLTGAWQANIVDYRHQGKLMCDVVI
jgi:thymidylate synthase